MSSYIVESYLSRSRSLELSELVERIRAVSEALAAEGVHVLYLRSTFVPNDEMCLHFFEATTIGAIRVAAERADLGPDRISEALDGLPLRSDPEPRVSARAQGDEGEVPR